MINLLSFFLLQSKLMKGFSNQLIEKHRYIRYISDGNSSPSSLQKISRDFDKLINLQQFLHVIDLHPDAVKVRQER